MTTLEEYLVRFRTVDDAARQGLIKSLDGTGESPIEFGGLIFQDERGRYYLADGGPRAGTKDNVAMRGRPVKAGDQLAAAYHSHPSADKRGEFSGEDTHSARSFGIPLFMAQAFNLDAHVFDPSTESKRRNRASLRDSETSSGQPFMSGHKMQRETP